MSKVRQKTLSVFLCVSLEANPFLLFHFQVVVALRTSVLENRYNPSRTTVSGKGTGRQARECFDLEPGKGRVLRLFLAGIARSQQSETIFAGITVYVFSLYFLSPVSGQVGFPPQFA